MLKAKIAVLVSGGGTNLQALIDAQKSGSIKSGEIALVISSNPSAYALTRAKDNNIPSAAVSKKECKSQTEFEEKIIENLKNAGALLAAEDNNSSSFGKFTSIKVASNPSISVYNLWMLAISKLILAKSSLPYLV